MSRVVFCELPSASYWSGVAQLVSGLVEQGLATVIVETMDDAQHLSHALWGLPPSALVPHGIEGIDGDAEVDPVVISVGVPRLCRPIVIHAALALEDLAVSDLVVEVVPRDDRLRELSRKRFKAYRERGSSPEFLPWDSRKPGRVCRES